MIYAIGLDSDQTFIHFLAEATQQGVRIQPINLRAVLANGTWGLRIPGHGSSSVSIEGACIRLEPSGSYYNRIIDLSTVQLSVAAAVRWQNLVVGLSAWLEQIPGIVINRPGGHGHNSSKPFHEHLLAQWGFDVPASLTSSDQSELAAFASDDDAIVKPVSGVRANSRIVLPVEFENFDSSRGPVHLQRLVRGADVRVHAVGQAVHAELIRGDAVDYRAARKFREFAPHSIPASLARKIIGASEAMGLIFSGWDFKLADDGRYWCLEANPMPGYDSYDRRLGGAVTCSLLAALKGTSTCSNGGLTAFHVTREVASPRGRVG